MGKTLICDGLGQTADGMLSDFNNRCDQAESDFLGSKELLPYVGDLDYDNLNKVNDGLTDIFGEINNGITFGSLGNVSKCLGLSGMTFDLNGNIANMPNWGVQSLIDRINCQVRSLASLPFESLMKLLNQLKNSFDPNGIDSLLGLLGCIDGTCDKGSYSSYPSPLYVESRMNKVGLNIDGSLDLDQLTDGVEPTGNLATTSSETSQPEWNQEYLNKVVEVSDNYTSTVNLLYTATNNDPNLSNMAARILYNNSPKC